MRRLLIIVFIFPFLGVACVNSVFEKVKEAAHWSAQESGRIIDERGEGYAANLTDEQKRIIDEWLESNNLNKYGDPKGTMYTGGTPLFDETTGDSVDRFEYLFNKLPRMKDVVENYEE